ncbi:MAG: penicillin amidase, partial [Myxococcota bacterium]
MKMRNSLLGLTLLAAALMGSGCSSDDDAADTGTTTGGSDTGTTDGMELPPEGADWFPAPDVGPDSWDNLVGLDGPVRVVFDDKNIPHIYAETEHDLAMAQGWVTARNRLFQLHTLRMAPSGRLAELLGSGSLAGDVLLRTHRLRLTAEAMAEKTRVEQPELYALLEAFASGVNQWIDRINAGTAAPPIEVGAFGNQLEPWTPADTMTIVRLQTWQLGFGGQFDADTAFATAMELQETFDGTNIEGVELDVLNATPPESTPTINGWGASKPGARASRFDLAKALNSKTLKRVPKSMREAMVKGSRQMAELPHNLLRGMGNDSKDWGSNNWVVSGEHTASGKPLVCNDPHLSLRNPAIFFQVHLSNKLAGGDYELSGVNFAGAPGIVLGTNGKIAWGATVFFSDVTDVYVETLSDDGKTVLFNGEQVALTERIESFDYIKPSGEGCEAAITGWMNNLSPQVEATGDYACRVTMTIKEVPHHGPLIPWTIGTDNDGKPMAMSWKWTGFEPTDDMLAVDHINRATNFEEFKAALNHFGVGAQNWVYGDQEGNIGWYPSHLLPIRKHVAECQATPGCVVEHPPFLPMPGDGSAEWDGFVPRDEIPQAYNPPEGFLVTANADPTGTSFDNDPFNDGHHYLGWVWPAGFRMAQAHKRVAAAVEKG